MAFPQFAELWKLIDLLVRKDFRREYLCRLEDVSADGAGACAGFVVADRQCESHDAAFSLLAGCED